MIKTAKTALGASVLAALLAVPVAAQQGAETGAFDLLIGGIKAAEFRYSGQQTETSYAISAEIESAGLVSLIKQLRYDGAAKGAVVQGRFAPESYRESADTGKRQSDAVLEYQQGLPQIVSFTSTSRQRADPVDPATMGGSVDPLTAFYTILNAVDKDAECNLTIEVFDGRRASKLQLGMPQASGDLIFCPGTYIRVQGFTAKEMAQKRRFSFTLTLAPSETGQMQVIEVQSETIYGKAVLKRR